MTSPAKIYANRRNALRSTGPRTEAGKARSHRNALKHGLSVPLDRDASSSKQVEVLTTELMELISKPREFIRSIAEQQLEVARIRQVRIGMIELEETGEDLNGLSAEARVTMATAAALSEIAVLGRYERRAVSKFNKTLRLLESLKDVETPALLNSHLRPDRKKRSQSGGPA
jgi:hypothetical protein